MVLLEPDVIPSPPVFCSGKGCDVVPPNPNPTGLVGPWIDDGWTCLLHKGPDDNSFAMRWLCPRCSQAAEAQAQLVPALEDLIDMLTKMTEGETVDDGVERILRARVALRAAGKKDA